MQNAKRKCGRPFEQKYAVPVFTGTAYVKFAAGVRYQNPSAAVFPG